MVAELSNCSDSSDDPCRKKLNDLAGCIQVAFRTIACHLLMIPSVESLYPSNLSAHKHAHMHVHVHTYAQEELSRDLDTEVPT